MLAVLSILSMSFLAGLSGAIMPGPILTLTMAEAAKRGARAGPLIVLGHGLLELAMVCALVVGLARILNRPAVFGTIGVVGGLALLVMAAAMIRTPAFLPDSAGGRSGVGGAFGPAALGAGISLANPYWTVWWVTVGVGILARAVPLGMPGIVAFFAGHILADLGWYTVVAVGIASGRRFLTPAVYRGLVIACGAALGGLGAWFLWSGGRTLLKFAEYS